MNNEVPTPHHDSSPNRGFGSVGFIATLGLVLALFAALMLLRPWEKPPVPDMPKLTEPSAQNDTNMRLYYEQLANACKDKQSEGCCMASVERMRSGNFKLAPQEGCPVGYRPSGVRCIDSYGWCEPVPTDSSTSSAPESSAQQSNFDTSGWKTYRHEKYGFELRYPNDWHLKENNGCNYDLSVVSLSSPETQQEVRKECPDDISIYWYQSIVNVPENRLGATTLEDFIRNNKMISKIGPTELGGIPATEVSWVGNGTYYAILAMKDSNLYEIFFAQADNKSAVTNIEWKILSTFQFIK